jgi:hypothetical protein
LIWLEEDSSWLSCRIHTAREIINLVATITVLFAVVVGLSSQHRKLPV